MGKKSKLADCVRCVLKSCYQGKDCFGFRGQAQRSYSSEDLKITRTATQIESEHYMKMTRLEEVILFGRNMSYTRLGIAFCIGLSDEAKTIADLLAPYFEIVSVCCKICGIPKEKFDLPKIDSTRDESMCNPLGQALHLNNAQTDLNLIVGLCIGHDILFTKNSAAPVSTLIVKDRVLGHNPAAAIYSGYHRKRIAKPVKM
jgi:uncharacterized metal-binding protein